jgi:hypothetical protein
MFVSCFLFSRDALLHSEHVGVRARAAFQTGRGCQRQPMHGHALSWASLSAGAISYFTQAQPQTSSGTPAYRVVHGGVLEVGCMGRRSSCDPPFDDPFVI